MIPTIKFKLKATEFYIIGEEEKYFNINECKRSVYLNYSGRQRIALNGKHIIGYNKPCEMVVSLTKIEVNESGKYKFGKTIKNF